MEAVFFFGRRRRLRDGPPFGEGLPGPDVK